jgi:peptidyl-prolyl cis-trans isomerase B (cyclophilin B)
MEVPASEMPRTGLTTVRPSPQQNGFAIAAVILAFLCWPLGIVCGHLALRRDRYPSGAGAPLAVVALVVSCLLGVATVVLLIVYFGHVGQGPPMKA